MPKSKRRKGGKKKSQQYGKQVKSQRKGAAIKQERLGKQLIENYRKEYEKQIKDELERRESISESTKTEMELDSRKELDMDFLGGANNLFESQK